MASGEAVSIARAIEIALTHHQAGRLSEAEGIYRQVMAFDPKCFDALHLLGVVAYQQHCYEEAVGLIERATAVNPASAQAFSNLGLAYRGLNQLERAKSCFQEAISKDPSFVIARNNLAITHRALGDSSSAMAELKAIIAQKPDYAEAHNNLAGILQEEGRLDEAIRCYDRALALAPGFAEAHLNRGHALAKLHRRAEAIASYRQALSLNPDLVEANYRLGTLLQAEGFHAEAIDCFELELAVNPGFVEARWALTMAQLGSVYDANAVSGNYRDAFAAALCELDAWFVGERVALGARAVGSNAPFYLAYVEQNNRDLLSRYGDLCARLMKHWQDVRGLAHHTTTGVDPIRVGIVSGHLRNHSVWTAIVKGWMQNLDRTRMSLHVFYTGSAEDDETRLAMSEASFYLQESSSLEDLAKAIVDQQLDVIVYPEIGMDPMTIRLASMRLAPVQAVAWGHPETSGFPTIDYFLSAECFEPPNAQDYYRERLVALPHLGCHYQRLDVTPADPDLRALGLDRARPILVCPGTPYKYHPQHDGLLVEIARRTPAAQLVLFDGHDYLSERLQHRLQRAFRQAGMRSGDQMRFIPSLPRPAFFGLLRHTTAVLDTIGFSGFNTAMQVIQCGVPLVTLEGHYMRGRLGSGILRRMGLVDMIATTGAEYVDFAVRLASDAGFRAHTRDRLVAKAVVLFDDPAPIRAFESFLVGVTRGRRDDHR